MSCTILLKVNVLTTLFSEGRSHYCTSASNSSLELAHLVLSLGEFRKQQDLFSMCLDGCQQLGFLFFFFFEVVFIIRVWAAVMGPVDF